MKRIRRIEYYVASEDLTIWFEDSEEPFNVREFLIGTPTSIYLNKLETEIKKILWALGDLSHSLD